MLGYYPRVSSIGGLDRTKKGLRAVYRTARPKRGSQGPAKYGIAASFGFVASPRNCPWFARPHFPPISTAVRVSGRHGDTTVVSWPTPHALQRQSGVMGSLYSRADGRRQFLRNAETARPGWAGFSSTTRTSRRAIGALAGQGSLFQPLDEVKVVPSTLMFWEKLHLCRTRDVSRSVCHLFAVKSAQNSHGRQR